MRRWRVYFENVTQPPLRAAVPRLLTFWNSMDLLTFLTSKYVEQLDLPRADTDPEWARHALDAAMDQEEIGAELPPNRTELLAAYLSLTVADLDTLPIR